SRMLHLCIAALDYCPPMDITFGDYLRAMVTANFEHDPVDKEGRSVAVVEAFRRYGIVPEDVRTLSVDGLLWRPTSGAPDEDEPVHLELVTSWVKDIAQWNLTKSRRELFTLMAEKRKAMHKYLAGGRYGGFGIFSSLDPSINVEVHSVRPSIRTD